MSSSQHDVGFNEDAPTEMDSCAQGPQACHIRVPTDWSRVTVLERPKRIHDEHDGTSAGPEVHTRAWNSYRLRTVQPAVTESGTLIVVQGSSGNKHCGGSMSPTGGSVSASVTYQKTQVLPTGFADT